MSSMFALCIGGSVSWDVVEDVSEVVGFTDGDLVEETGGATVKTQ